MEDTLITIAGCLIALIMAGLLFTALYVGGWLLWGALKDAYRWFMEN